MCRAERRCARPRGGGVGSQVGNVARRRKLPAGCRARGEFIVLRVYSALASLPHLQHTPIQLASHPSSVSFGFSAPRRAEAGAFSARRPRPAPARCCCRRLARAFVIGPYQSSWRICDLSYGLFFFFFNNAVDSRVSMGVALSPGNGGIRAKI